MANELETKVWEALQDVTFPGMSRSIVSFGFVRQVDVDGDRVTVGLEMSTHKEEAAETVRAEVEKAVRGVDGVGDAVVTMKVKTPQSPGAAAQKATARDSALLPEVGAVIAVASGKGGVGKSTVAANLAVALAQQGHSVGLLDADIYGPSMPTMFGITDKPRVEANRVVPFDRHGVKVMSLGFILDTDTPVIWRGPMVMKALEQMLGDVAWGALDFLVVDLPPGTGDAQLTITQRVPLSGAVIVTTPQDVALIDARKGLAMFRKVEVPVIGIVENMSGFVCPHCGEETDVFKRGGGERTAEVLGTRFLGAIPLDPRIVQGGDAGEPIASVDAKGPHGQSFRAIAKVVAEEARRQVDERTELSIV